MSSGSEEIAAAPSGAETLFARKGSATPASAKGGRPALFIVGNAAAGAARPGDSERNDAGKPDTSTHGAGFRAPASGPIGEGAPAPAASLDSDPFDPVRLRALAFDDAASTAHAAADVMATDDENRDADEPTNATDATIEDETDQPVDDWPDVDGEILVDVARIPPQEPPRLRPMTVTLVGAAVIAAVAAAMTALSWYDYPGGAAPAGTERESAGMAAVQQAIPVMTPAAANAPAAGLATTDSATTDSATTDSAAPTTAGTTPVDGIDSSVSAPAASPAVREPAIELVRVEPQGETVIAGTAAPGTELIVLDNGVAIGTAVAGETGDWMLMPDTPLGGGDHEIALAIKTGGGAVSVAAPQLSPDAVPLPRPAAASFVVQVASVKTAAGAEQEWARLKAALPEIVGDLEPAIDSAQLTDRGTFYRIRLGPFADREAARALCATLSKAGRDCLVVRR